MDDLDPLIGRQVGASAIRIVKKIGQGGMGSVYLGRHGTLDIDVAVKFLPPSLVENDIARQRFLREARAAAKLEHHNLVRVLDVSVEEDYPYLVMEFVTGRTVSRLIKERGGRLPVDEAVRLARAAAIGLAACHALGVIHRDIKPDNLMVTHEGRLKVADFGLARDLDSNTLSITGSIIGSPAFMSPEQASGKTVDERTDVCSLGLTLYAMLAGDSPFTRSNAMASLMAALDAPVPSLRQLNPDVPLGLEAVVMAMIERDRDRRVPTMAAVIALLDGDLSHALPPLPPLRSAEPRQDEAPTIPKVQAARRASRLQASAPRPPRITGPSILLIGGAAVAVILVIVIVSSRFRGSTQQDVAVTSSADASSVASPPASSTASSSALASSVTASVEASSSAIASSALASSSAAASLPVTHTLEELREQIVADCDAIRFQIALERVAFERSQQGTPISNAEFDQLIATIEQRAWLHFEQQLAATRDSGADLAGQLRLVRALETWQLPRLEQAKNQAMATLNDQLQLELSWVEMRDALAGRRVERAVAMFNGIAAAQPAWVEPFEITVTLRALAQVSHTWRQHLRRLAERPVVTLAGVRMELAVASDDTLRAYEAGSMTVVTPPPDPDQVPLVERVGWCEAGLATAGLTAQERSRWSYWVALYCFHAGENQEALKRLARVTELPEAEALRQRLQALVPDQPRPEVQNHRKQAEEVLRAALALKQFNWVNESADDLRCRITLDCKLPSELGRHAFGFEPNLVMPFANNISSESARYATPVSKGIELTNGFLHLDLAHFHTLHRAAIKVSWKPFTLPAAAALHVGGRSMVLYFGTNKGVYADQAGGLRLNGAGEFFNRLPQGESIHKSISSGNKTTELVFELSGLKRSWRIGERLVATDDEFERINGADLALASWGAVLVIEEIVLEATLDLDRSRNAWERLRALQALAERCRKEGQRSLWVFNGKINPASEAPSWPNWSLDPGRGLLFNELPYADVTLLAREVAGAMRMDYSQHPIWPKYYDARLYLGRRQYMLPQLTSGSRAQRIEVLQQDGMQWVMHDNMLLIPTDGFAADRFHNEPRVPIMLSLRGCRFFVKEAHWRSLPAR
jgi:serine/threonine-protein kinase